ncbi:MAG TPA: mannitol dehydrogenase family protein, partial [Nocardioides sp.]
MSATRSAPTAPAYRDRLSPGIVHLGVGAFHRSHQAVYLDDLFRRATAGTTDEGALTWGVRGIGTTSHDRPLHAALAAQDHLWTVETREADGAATHQVVGALLDHVVALDDAAGALEPLTDPRVRWATLTVTEGGYPVDPETLALRPDDGLLADLEGVRRGRPPTSATALLVAGLEARRRAGLAPYAVVSCDNVQHNGAITRAAVLGAAALVDHGLADWIGTEVAFPATMVDRITPATTVLDVERIRAATGVDDACPVVAEPFRQWVLEDVPGLARPALEEVGVQVVPDVAPYELLKLRVLNGGHQALAWPGLLLGHHHVHEAATDPDVAGFVRRFHAEVIPTLDPVPGEDPEAYAATVLQRFAQPHLPDTLERLAAHSEDRMPGFVLPAATASVRAGRAVPATAALVALWWAVLRQRDP